MFADGIRLSGLEILAQHRIHEGMALCVAVIEPDRWGQNKRIPRCLKTLQQYGGAAKEVLPQLKRLESLIKKEEHLELLRQTVAAITDDTDPLKLRSLNQSSPGAE